VLFFTATVGELNAAKFLIASFQQQWTDTTLLLLGHEQYLNTYANIYPEAIIVKPLPSSPKLIDQLFSLAKPRLVVFVEGPSLHRRFPIRLDITLPVQCLKDKVPIIVVNACLYKNYINSTIDKIEHKLFSNLHLQAIAQWYVANEAFKTDLKSEGIPVERISVMGDIKFDAIFSSGLPQPNSELSEILNYYKNESLELIVAGSIISKDEVEAVVTAWRKVKKKRPLIRLILAPR
jgi:3-deoxy-D-manno-octulosonic-acid transferase